MKPFYRDKGKYKDGRRRVVIERRIGRDIKSKALPKPEILWDILDTLKLNKIMKGKTHENGH